MKNRAIEVFMWIAAVSVVSNIYLFIPIYSVVAEGLMITYEEVVFSSTLFTSCYAIGLLSFGFIATFSPKRMVLFYGMIASSLLTIFLSFSFSFSLSSFYLLRCCQGFVLGSFAPVAYAYCFDVFEPKRRMLVISIINTGFLMSGIIGQLISSTIVIAFGWREVFYLFACLYMGIAFCTLFILPKERLKATNKTTNATTSPGKLLPPPVLLGLSIAFITLMSFVSFYDGLAKYYTGQEEALFYSRCIALIGTPLSLFNSIWLKKYSTKQILLTCLFIIVLSLLLMLFTKQIIFVTMLSTLFVSAIAVFIPTLITFIGNEATTKRSIAISLYTFILLSGASLGPIIATYLSFQCILYLFSFLFSSSMILLFFTKVQKTDKG